MKYKDWLITWLDNYVKPIAKNKTYMRYSEIVFQRLIPFLGDHDMEEIKPLIIQKYITVLLNSGNLKTGKGLSANTINSILNVIKDSLTVAYNIGIIDEIEFHKVKRPHVQEKTIECFSLSEQKSIEQAVLNDKRDKMIGIIICLYTGLRLGEVLALEWDDIDFSKHELNVNKTCHDAKSENGKYFRVTNSPKTANSNRIIPIPRQIIPLLKAVKKKSNSKYVVANGEKTISLRSYQRSFELLQKKLKIPKRGFHSLRHTFATRAIECGMDVKTLSEILGHKNATITLKRYVHSLMSHKKEYMNKIGQLL